MDKSVKNSHRKDWRSLGVIICHICLSLLFNVLNLLPCRASQEEPRSFPPAPNCQYEHFSTALNTPPLNSSTPKVYSQLLVWRGCPPAAKTSVFHSRFVPTGRMLLKANLIVQLKDQLAPPGDCMLSWPWSKLLQLSIAGENFLLILQPLNLTFAKWT